MLHLKVPKLKNPNIVFRVTTNPEQIKQANNLVLHNYFDVGLWADSDEFAHNLYIHSPARTCFVAMDGDHVIATASTVRDGVIGLPADKFQPLAIDKLRSLDERMAEITALAVDHDSNHDRGLILFLYAFIFQYNFFYAGIDRLVASTTERHARFYESIFGFHRLSAAAEYYYVKLKVQLLTIHLICDRLALAQRYQIEREHARPCPNNFYHFLLTQEHDCFEYPDPGLMRRARNIDWLLRARHFGMALAV